MQRGRSKRRGAGGSAIDGCPGLELNDAFVQQDCLTRAFDNKEPNLSV